MMMRTRRDILKWTNKMMNYKSQKVKKKYIDILYYILPTNGTSGSESIASRVKVLRRPINKKQKQSRPPGTALASPGSKQYK